MILTNCAACAAPLAHDAPRCVRCRTRYCNQTCQHDHWRRGHKQMCKKIHRGGNAEHYHANKKFKEALAVAVEACVDGPVLYALGWGCWKMYASYDPLTAEDVPNNKAVLPEALGTLGMCMSGSGHCDEAEMVHNAIYKAIDKERQQKGI